MIIYFINNNIRQNKNVLNGIKMILNVGKCANVSTVNEFSIHAQSSYDRNISAGVWHVTFSGWREIDWTTLKALKDMCAYESILYLQLNK